MNLSEHFTLEEFVRSGKARVLSIANTPGTELLPAMRRTCDGLERILLIVESPIILLSGYRSHELNTLVGGSATSQHMRGEAADIICPGFGAPVDLARHIHSHKEGIAYDQLIIEGTWVHVSFALKPRLMALTKTADGYVQGIA